MRLSRRLNLLEAAQGAPAQLADRIREDTASWTGYAGLPGIVPQ
jgi:hypothetical protein